MKKDISLLLVEDNPRFSEAAKDFLVKNVPSLYLNIAYDYDGAIQALQSGRNLDGVITDCFFPKSANSDDRSLGELAIEKMLSEDNRGKRIEEYERELAPYFHNQDQGVRRIIRYIGSLSQEEKPVRSAVVQVVKLIGQIDKDKLGEMLKKDKWLFPRIENFKDYYEELRALISRDPFNQPLGILVAEECQNKGIPVVLATSTYHHDALTQPIQDYCSRHKWHLEDCSPTNPNEKATQGFWQRAYETLLQEIRGRK